MYIKEPYKTWISYPQYKILGGGGTSKLWSKIANYSTLNLTVGCMFYNVFLLHYTNLTGNDNQQIVRCTDHNYT